jgi:hypothetical protein
VAAEETRKPTAAETAALDYSVKVSLAASAYQASPTVKDQAAAAEQVQSVQPVLHQQVAQAVQGQPQVSLAQHPPAHTSPVHTR